MAYILIFRVRRPDHLCWLLAVALAVYSAAAMARPLVPDKPSVEVHLEALRALKIDSASTSFAAPVTPVEVVGAGARTGVGASYSPRGAQKPQPQSTEKVTRSGRKIPKEQPIVGQYEGVRNVPVSVPFATGQSPALRASEPLAPPSKKTAPLRKPAAKKSVEVEEPSSVPLPSPPPEPEPEPPPSEPPAQVEAEPTKPQVAPQVKDPSSTVVLPPVDLPPLPTDPEPVAPTPMKPVPLEPTLPDLPPLPGPQTTGIPPSATSKATVLPILPDAGKEALLTPSAPRVVPIPPLAPPALPQATPLPPTAPGLPANAPEVMVVDKTFAKKLPDMPTLPPLPDLPQAEDKEVALPPTVEKRMETIFAKQPEKQGIISDKTQRIDPNVEAKEDSDSAAKKEASRKAMLDAKIKPEDAPAAEVPAPLMPPVALPIVAPAPPVEKLPEKIELAAIGEAELPPMPPLPALTPITGSEPEKTSLDIVEPQDGVTSKDLGSKKSAVVMQPFDAPENLPKVTSAKGEKGEEDHPATLPPSTADGKQEELPAVDIDPSLAEPEPSNLQEKQAELSPEEKKAHAGETLRAVFFFDRDQINLDDEKRNKLKELAKEVKKYDWQLRIIAYASGTPEQSSLARRISLSRALQVRAQLIEGMVNAYSINVQAMGNKKTTGNPNRVDVFVR